MTTRLLTVAALLLTATTAHAVEPDKYAHAGISAALAASVDVSLHHRPARVRIPVALISTLAVGVAKEAIDPVFDWEDIAADAIGAAIGVAVGEGLRIRPTHNGFLFSMEL